MNPEAYAPTDWTELVRVLRACQAICRQLAEEALLRIEGDLRPDTGVRQRNWLEDEKTKLEQLLAQLGAPL